MRTQISKHADTIRRGLLIASLVLAGAWVGRSAERDLDGEVKNAVDLFKKTDPKIQNTFDQAYGYAVFPSVAKGAAGIGAAQGTGEVFEKGKLIGTAEMTQVTVGAQLGGESYSELVFFETKEALDGFKSGKLAMSATANAVAAADGVAANAKYQQGVLIFTMAKTGLMFEASVGGQKFSFTLLPKE